MRNYQRKRNNPYMLPHNVYMQAYYLVRDYDRLRALERDIIYSTPSESLHIQNAPGDSTAYKVCAMESVSERIRAIENAIADIPEEYQKGVMLNTKDGVQCPLYASESTWRRYRARLLFFVAKYMNWI